MCTVTTNRLLKFNCCFSSAVSLHISHPFHINFKSHADSEREIKGNTNIPIPSWAFYFTFISSCTLRIRRAYDQGTNILPHCCHQDLLLTPNYKSLGCHGASSGDSLLAKAVFLNDARKRGRGEHVMNKIIVVCVALSQSHDYFEIVFCPLCT